MAGSNSWKKISDRCRRLGKRKVVGLALCVLLGSSALAFSSRAWITRGASEDRRVITRPTEVVLAEQKTAQRLEDECGIRIEHLDLTAGGDMAKLIYRVTDLKLAQKAFQGKIGLIDEKSRQVMEVPEMPLIGLLRQKPAVTNGFEFILLNNGERKLQSGSKATLILGQKRYTGLIVR